MAQTTKSLFTTGQVTGLLQISLSSLQLYIREYRDYLSPTASQQKQGRRYTPQDVECLMMIRNLRFRRADKATIEEALQGDHQVEEPSYKLENMARILGEMQEVEARVTGQARQALGYAKQIEGTKGNVDYIVKKLRASQDDFYGDVDALSLKVISLQEQIDDLTKKVRNLEYNRPFSLWEWITDKFGL